MSSFNNVLLQKWHCHFFNEYEAAWIKLIQAIHGGTGGLDVVNGYSVTNGVSAKLVRSIRKMHDICVIPLSTLQKRVGKGNSIMSWKDIWVGHQPFAIRFDHLYILNISLDCFVSDRFYNDIWN